MKLAPVLKPSVPICYKINLDIAPTISIICRIVHYSWAGKKYELVIRDSGNIILRDPNSILPLVRMLNDLQAGNVTFDSIRKVSVNWQNYSQIGGL